MAEQTWKAECMKATCRHVEYYGKNPGHTKCPKCGSTMLPRRQS